MFFADIAKSISSRLEDNLASGKYSEIDNDIDLSKVLTADLRSVNNDKHLVLSLMPPSRRDAKEPDEGRSFAITCKR